VVIVACIFGLLIERLNVTCFVYGPIEPGEEAAINACSL